MPEYKPIQKIQVVDGVSGSILSTGIYSTYYIYGTATLSTNWAVTMSGTAYEGMKVKFEYRATVTLSGNHITFLGTQMPDAYASKKVNVDCYYNGSAWVVDYQPSFDEAGVVTATMIDTITVAQVTGTASKVMEFTAGGVGQASATTATELGYLAGTTPGTVVANKAIVPTTGKAIDEIDVTTTLKKGGVEITASAAELNLLDTAVAGTIVPSKAVIVDSNGKVNTWDPTILKINGQTVTASGTELSELNGAGVVNADFVVLKDLAANGVVEADLAVLKDLAANGVVEADLALIAGAASAGVTTTDIQSTKPHSVAKVQTKIQVVNTDASIDVDAGVVVVDLTANTTLNVPDGDPQTEQVVKIIVRVNAASAHNLIFDSPTGDDLWYSGTSANTKTIATIAPNTVVTLANMAAGVWVIGV